MGYIYLGSPYTSESEAKMNERYEAALHCTGWLLGKRTWAYSPIVHCHHLVKSRSLPPGFDFWADFDYSMISQSDSMYILTIKGWRESRGLKKEAGFCLANDIPIWYVEPINNGYTVSSKPLLS